MKKRKERGRKSGRKDSKGAAKDKALASRGNKAGGSRKRAVKTVDEYIASVPEPARSSLMEMRAAIRSAVPVDAVEIISYQIPAFKTNKVLVWYAAFAEHCSLFPTASVIEAYKDQLRGFKISKGTVQFPMDKPLPSALIKKLVKARVARV